MLSAVHVLSDTNRINRTVYHLAGFPRSSAVVHCRALLRSNMMKGGQWGVPLLPLETPNVGTLMIRIGFGGILYYDYIKPPNTNPIKP